MVQWVKNLTELKKKKERKKRKERKKEPRKFEKIKMRCLFG